MRRMIVAGNWKMHGSKVMVESLLRDIIAEAPEENAMDVIVFPPYVYLDLTQQMLESSTIAWGAQNMAQADMGAYTGEISARMLQEFGCQYVILGHSERRQLFGETNIEIIKKYVLAHEHGLIPILCVGETLQEREANETFLAIEKQLEGFLTLENSLKLLQNTILAYEPVWAIGTGKTATPEQAEAVHHWIRTRIATLDPTLATNVRILYGGSVKASNAQGLFAMPNIDGGLIGGASLNVNEFMEICQCSL